MLLNQGFRTLCFCGERRLEFLPDARSRFSSLLFGLSPCFLDLGVEAPLGLVPCGWELGIEARLGRELSRVQALGDLLFGFFRRGTTRFGNALVVVLGQRTQVRIERLAQLRQKRIHRTSGLLGGHPHALSESGSAKSRRQTQERQAFDGKSGTPYNGRSSSISPQGGEPDSTGVRFRRMRAEDHQPR